MSKLNKVGGVRVSFRGCMNSGDLIIYPGRCMDPGSVARDLRSVTVPLHSTGSESCLRLTLRRNPTTQKPRVAEEQLCSSSARSAKP